jgi:hypothetical protein
LLLGDEHPGGGPALAHVAVLPALDVSLGVTDDLAERSQQERTRREDRHSKFYEVSDNLRLGYSLVTRHELRIPRTGR